MPQKKAKKRKKCKRSTTMSTTRPTTMSDNLMLDGERLEIVKEIPNKKLITLPIVSQRMKIRSKVIRTKDSKSLKPKGKSDNDSFVHFLGLSSMSENSVDKKLHLLQI
jgi:hypothetical protein